MQSGSSKEEKQDSHQPSRRPQPAHNTKHLGEVAEMEFMLQAHVRGYPVGKPFGDNEHYDVLVDSRQQIWRVQVKIATPQKHNTFSFRSSWTGYNQLFPYTPDQIDFLAAFVRQHDIWYLIPATEIKGRLLLNVHPFGIQRRRRNGAEFEKYKEAWHLLTR